jgi:hypothetical protein
VISKGQRNPTPTSQHTIDFHQGQASADIAVRIVHSDDKRAVAVALSQEVHPGWMMENVCLAL